MKIIIGACVRQISNKKPEGKKWLKHVLTSPRTLGPSLLPPLGYNSSASIADSLEVNYMPPAALTTLPSRELTECSFSSLQVPLSDMQRLSNTSKMSNMPHLINFIFSHSNILNTPSDGFLLPTSLEKDIPNILHHSLKQNQRIFLHLYQ